MRSTATWPSTAPSPSRPSCWPTPAAASKWIGFNGSGTFLQSGGTHLGRALIIGGSTGGSGSYTLSGAASLLKLASAGGLPEVFDIGAGDLSQTHSVAAGTFVQTGGTF